MDIADVRTDSGPAQDGLRALLAANRSIVEDLSLPAVLRRVVAAAQVVASARYAALGVIGPDGLLEQFVHTGMDDARDHEHHHDGDTHPAVRNDHLPPPPAP